MTPLPLVLCIAAGYVLAHIRKFPGHERALRAARERNEKIIAELARLELELERAVNASRNIDPREQRARQLAREALASFPARAFSHADGDETRAWLIEQEANSGHGVIVRVCSSAAGLRELAESSPRNAGDAIMFPLYAAREMLGLAPFEGVEDRKP